MQFRSAFLLIWITLWCLGGNAAKSSVTEAKFYAGKLNVTSPKGTQKVLWAYVRIAYWTTEDKIVQTIKLKQPNAKAKAGHAIDLFYLPSKTKGIYTSNVKLTAQSSEVGELKADGEPLKWTRFVINAKTVCTGVSTPSDRAKYFCDDHSVTTMVFTSTGMTLEDNMYNQKNQINSKWTASLFNGTGQAYSAF
jgi:hypothetical protein